MSTDRLDDLVIPEEPVDPTRLTRVLSPYLRLSGSSDSHFHYQDQYFDLPASDQVLVVLAGELARSSLGLADDEWLTPVDISRIAELDLGTAYPAVRSLEQRGIVENDSGNYRLDPAEFDRAATRLDR